MHRADALPSLRYGRDVRCRASRCSRKGIASSANGTMCQEERGGAYTRAASATYASALNGAWFPGLAHAVLVHVAVGRHDTAPTFPAFLLHCSRHGGGSPAGDVRSEPPNRSSRWQDTGVAHSTYPTTGMVEENQKHAQLSQDIIPTAAADETLRLPCRLRSPSPAYVAVRCITNTTVCARRRVTAIKARRRPRCRYPSAAEAREFHRYTAPSSVETHGGEAGPHKRRLGCAAVEQAVQHERAHEDEHPHTRHQTLIDFCSTFSHGAHVPVMMC